MRAMLYGLGVTIISSPAWAAGTESLGVAPFHWGLYLTLAMASLGIIVYASLFVEKLATKALLFVGLGAVTYTFLHTTGGAEGVLHHVYHVDYPQFIGIPAVTVLIASMNLLALKVGDDFKPGWFMAITVPIIGNFATTWALVPIAVSLFPVIKAKYPGSYWTKMIVMFIFGANILALGTVLADPPQAYWAVQLANAGTPMSFFYTGSQFWLFMLMTWALYAYALKHFGVEFGALKISALFPAFESAWKVGVAIAFCVAIAYALLYLEGYSITMFLGGVFAGGFLMAMNLGHHVRHDTIHWCVETFTIFIAFFAVVSYMHVMLENVEVANEGMVGAVMVLTWMADNAAAFAAGYPQFEGNETFMLWYNLFPSVTQGSASPLGNGPQIVAFLVIFTAKGYLSAGEVFKEWFKVCWIFVPYLFVWTFGAMVMINLGLGMTIYAQLLIGLLAVGTCLSFMSMTNRNMNPMQPLPA